MRIPWALLIEISGRCLTLEGDRIEARHLVAAAPALVALEPDTVFGYAPRPGVRRSIPGFELEAFGRKHGLSGVRAVSTCVERTTRRLDREQVERALQEAAAAIYGGPAAVEVRQFATYPVPPGKLVFPAGGISYPAADGEIHWRGYVEASPRAPVWAKARVEALLPVIVAREALPAGQLIRADQVAVEPRAVSIRALRWPLPDVRSGNQAVGGRSSSLAAAVGKIPLRRIEAGDIIPLHLLREPPAVHARDTIRVETVEGSVRLSVAARAETSGRLGDRIVVRNLDSGRRFLAVVTGPRAAEVAAAAAPGNPGGREAATGKRPDALHSAAREDFSRRPDAAHDGVGFATPEASGLLRGPLRQSSSESGK